MAKVDIEHHSLEICLERVIQEIIYDLVSVDSLVRIPIVQSQYSIEIRVCCSQPPNQIDHRIIKHPICWRTIRIWLEVIKDLLNRSRDRAVCVVP